MRRYWREQQPPSMFRGAELTRLMTGVLMLAVLYMMITRAREASTWAWLAGDQSRTSTTATAPEPKAPEPRTPTPAPVAPEPTGPTDEDFDQSEAARHEFQAITDGTLRLGAEEMVPYNRIVEWVKNQPFALLWDRAKKGLRYSNLYDEPEMQRGQLVAYNLTVRLAVDAGKNQYGVPLCEVWGDTNESRGRFYAMIVVDYPKDMPMGDSLYEKAKFAGYFLKLQGYEPGLAKPGQMPEKAPLLIGRLEWTPAEVVASPVDSTDEWIWGLGVLAVIGLFFVFRWAHYKWLRRKPATGPTPSERAPGEVIPIDAWLDRANLASDDEASNGDEDDD